MINFTLLSANVDTDDETGEFDGMGVSVRSNLMEIEDVALRATLLIHIMNIAVGASVMDLEGGEKIEFVDIIKAGFSETVSEQAFQVAETDTARQDSLES
jgi:hypothetical protein